MPPTPVLAPHWTWLIYIASGIIVLNQLFAVVMSRSRWFVRWFRVRWLPSVQEATREERIDTMLEEFPKLLAEFRPNGGDSMRDLMNATIRTAQEHGDLLAQHIEESTADHVLLTSMDGKVNRLHNDMNMRMEKLEKKVGGGS